MPICIQTGLPAIDVLRSENIFVKSLEEAKHQDIRPLKIALLNLMPTKIATETQLARLLGNTALQVELELISVNHNTKNTSADHMSSFYKPFSEIKENKYDGLIITGAPIELMPFEQVDYWNELCEIMAWSRTNVYSTLHICWGAQAGLYYHYGIDKTLLDNKLSGVYKHRVTHKGSILFRGFDDEFFVPHSRNTTVLKDHILEHKELKILAESDVAGVYAVSTNGGRQIFLMGHAEYDSDTLKNEYLRDKNAGINPSIPVNYFPDNDDSKAPVCTWRSCANLLFSNWLNYFVYQSTPYDIETITAF